MTRLLVLPLMTLARRLAGGAAANAACALVLTAPRLSVYPRRLPRVVADGGGSSCAVVPRRGGPNAMGKPFKKDEGPEAAKPKPALSPHPCPKSQPPER